MTHTRKRAQKSKLSPTYCRAPKLPDSGLASKIERLRVGSLRPSPHNARTHSNRQIRLISKSIKEFGFTNPILIDEANQILAGHGRWSAAKLLGWPDVPTLQISHLSEAQKRAYIIADNQSTVKNS
jgi:ParB/RepB/Spo0J family partition protein